VTVDVATSGYVHQGRDADLVGDGRIISRVADAVVGARVCGSCCNIACLWNVSVVLGRGTRPWRQKYMPRWRL
jgi:hypothetical protein